jgi:hypothetical protein
MIGSSRLRSTTCPATAGIAVVERHHHGADAGHAGDRVGQPEGGQRRRPVGLAGQVGEAAHRLHQRAERGAIAVGAVLAEAGDAHDDQAGVDLVQPLGSEAPALEGAGPEVLHQDVGVPHEVEEQIGALRHGRGGDRRSACCGRSPSTTGPARRRRARARACRPGRSGCSTLMTSAPKSPRIWQISGPARIVEQSSTRIPASGPIDGSCTSPPDPRARTRIARRSVERNTIPLNGMVGARRSSRTSRRDATPFHSTERGGSYPPRSQPSGAVGVRNGTTDEPLHRQRRTRRGRARPSSPGSMVRISASQRSPRSCSCPRPSSTGC